MAFTIPTLMSISHIKSAIKQIVSNFGNYPELNENNKIAPNLIDLDSNNRLVTDANISNWNGKQDLSEKNQVNGYFGLDDNKRILSNKFLIPQKKLAFISDSSLATPSSLITWSLITNGGGGSYSGTGGANTVKVKSGNSTIIHAPTLTLSSSSTGYVAILANREIVNLYSPFKIFVEIKLSSLKNSIKQNKISIGIGTYQGVNGNWNGSGLTITIDPTENNGNYKFGKIIGGLATFSNASSTINSETLTSFIFEYDKLTEEANFYVDYELIGTFTGVNIPNNTNLREAISFYTGDATETVIRRCSIFSNNIELDLEG